MAKPSTHRKLLLQISEDLTQRDLDNLQFCCGDHISESEAKKVSKGTDLFVVLRKRNLLGPGQYGYLRECLTAIERRDLASRLPSELEAVLAQVPSCDRSLVYIGEESRFVPPALPSEENHDSIFSSKLHFLKIAERLSSEEVLKLAYLCSIELCEDSGEVGGVKVLFQLEKAGIIDPSQPETLAKLLQCIERRDLASLLFPAHNPRSAQAFGLDQASQLLGIKTSMLTHKHSHYVFQRRVLSTIVSSDRAVLEQQIVKPVLARLVESYNSSTLFQLCAPSLGTFKETGSFDDLLRNSLFLVSDFLEAYSDLFDHYLYCEGGVISVATLGPLFEKCHDCYNRFEAGIEKFPWNSTLRQHVKKDLAQRRTPFGSPAYNAMKCIYDICSELTDKVKVQSVMEGVDRNLYILECLFYGFSFRIVLSQWLKSILCLLGQNAVSVSYSADVLRSTLVQIVRTHWDQICCCYHKLASVLGKDIMKQLSAELLNEGVDIEASQQRHTLSQSELEEYVLHIKTLIFMDIFALLQLSYFGNKLELRDTLAGMRNFHYGFMTSSYFITYTMKIYKNLIRAYEAQIEGFRDSIIKSSCLCGPVLTQLMSL